MKGELGSAEQQTLRMLEFFGKKWTLKILKCLQQMGACRFNALEDDLSGISPKTLSDRLSEFQELGLVEKQTYSQIPPKTEYTLTEKGADLIGCLDCVEEWAERWAIAETAEE